MTSSTDPADAKSKVFVKQVKGGADPFILSAATWGGADILSAGAN
jgi:hypothetical protein